MPDTPADILPVLLFRELYACRSLDCPCLSQFERIRSSTYRSNPAIKPRSREFVLCGICLHVMKKCPTHRRLWDLYGDLGNRLSRSMRPGCLAEMERDCEDEWQYRPYSTEDLAEVGQFADESVGVQRGPTENASFAELYTGRYQFTHHVTRITTYPKPPLD